MMEIPRTHHKSSSISTVNDKSNQPQKVGRFNLNL